MNTDNSVTTPVRFPGGRQPAALRMNDNEAITEYQRLTVDLSDLEDFPWAYDESGVLYRCTVCGLPFLADEWASMPRALDSHTFEWFGCPGTSRARRARPLLPPSPEAPRPVIGPLANAAAFHL